MKCAWNELIGVIPPELRSEVQAYRDRLQELRLRLDRPAMMHLGNCVTAIGGSITAAQLQFTVNTACRYSPWASDTMKWGFVTAPGGHRIGICGEAVMDGEGVKTIRSVTSVNIRVARDYPGTAQGIPDKGNILILGPPGSGKTTLLRDLIRMISKKAAVTVIDERGELFGYGFTPGQQMDVLSFCPKYLGVEMALRTMGPQVIAVDEITAGRDCEAIRSAQWCGVRLLATVHASDLMDLKNRAVYRPLWESRCFDTFVIMHMDKSYRVEEL